MLITWSPEYSPFLCIYCALREGHMEDKEGKKSELLKRKIECLYIL